MGVAVQQNPFSTSPVLREESHRGSIQLALPTDVARKGQKYAVRGIQKVVSDARLDESNPDEPLPDSACRGWVDPPEQARIEALFVLAGLGLGIQRTDVVTTPVWLDLSEVEAMDAIGEPQGGLIHVEIVMKDSTVVGAGWTEAFCTAVVSALSGHSAVGAQTEDQADLPADPDATQGEHQEDPPSFTAEAAQASSDPVLEVAPPVVRDRSRLAEAASAEAGSVEGGSVEGGSVDSREFEVAAAPSEQAVVAPEPVESLSDVDPEGTSAGLELEDVVYLGGYPGQTKKRKNCTAVLTRTGLEVVGPADLRFRMSWDSVTSVEPQNSDEARFRMNTKIHRDSSALVIECDQGITLLLEARDCSTVPLRSAITQLLAGLPVLVV
ncbi:unannotated protein [freshwater metagenome]|uniref:Unannotated protein n=1 Tax=freshwater metagenome TaxID=449393 RepID=A0A6J6Z934_9ZZZZ